MDAPTPQGVGRDDGESRDGGTQTPDAARSGAGSPAECGSVVPSCVARRESPREEASSDERAFGSAGRCGGAAMDLCREAKAQGGPLSGESRLRRLGHARTRRASKRRAGGAEPVSARARSGLCPRSAAQSQERAAGPPQGARAGRPTAQASGGPQRISADSVVRLRWAPSVRKRGRGL
jgi:hypothetical protein